MSFQESLKILLLLFTTLQNIFFEQTPLFYFTNVKIIIKGTMHVYQYMQKEQKE